MDSGPPWYCNPFDIEENNSWGVTITIATADALFTPFCVGRVERSEIVSNSGLPNSEAIGSSAEYFARNGTPVLNPISWLTFSLMSARSEIAERSKTISNTGLLNSAPIGCSAECRSRGIRQSGHFIVSGSSEGSQMWQASGDVTDSRSLWLTFVTEVARGSRPLNSAVFARSFKGNPSLVVVPSASGPEEHQRTESNGSAWIGAIGGILATILGAVSLVIFLIRRGPAQRPSPVATEDQRTVTFGDENQFECNNPLVSDEHAFSDSLE
jgi:hypothetical protein